MFMFDIFQAVGDIFQRSLPVGFQPLAVLLEHRLRQALIAVQCFIRKTVFVADPAFVDRFVFQRQNPHDFIVFDLYHQIAAQTVVRAD